MNTLSVTYTDIASDPRAAAKVEARRAAVETYQGLQHRGKEAGLYLTILAMQKTHPNFSFSTRSLRGWNKAYRKHGLAGLVEQKRGIVGRHGVEVPPEFARLGKALVIERGSLAMAARELATHPDLPASMRMKLHDGYATKSYITPSIARAIRVAPLTKELIQGPRNARLKGRFTPCDYTEFRAGDYFVSDDMTSNVLCWCEWPNAHGWRIGQAQILPVMDVRSLRWLNVRVIMRDGGQYNAHDDIWGLFGDVFDTFGLPNVGFVLEGGHWQANAVQGVRTGLDTNIRIGGLESLGLQNVRSFDPRSKIIEGQFNAFQHHMDRFPGFAGRDQRTDMGEDIKKRVALMRVKNPQHHPKEFFPHISQLGDQVWQCMENMNHERQDGVVLRGQSPLELWAEHAPKLRSIPDSAKWLYRSAMNVSKVTANGVRVTRGSGPKMLVYYYDNPALLVPRQGTNVIIHWNDANPEADACLRDARGHFIGMAKHVKPLARFSASSEDLTRENARKQAALHYARTEMRSMQPDLVRDTVLVPVSETVEIIGAKMADASQRAESAEMATADLRGALPDMAGEIQPTNRVNFFAPSVPEAAAVSTVRQVRGVRAAVRGVVLGFGGRQFTLDEVRAKLPDALSGKVAVVLSHLCQSGELVKTKRADGCRVYQLETACQTTGEALSVKV